MDRVLESLARRSGDHPAPVLPVDELLRHQSPGPEDRSGPSARSVLADGLRTRPDLFRVLDPWRGPLKPGGLRHGPREMERHRVLERAGLPRTGWVVSMEAGPVSMADPSERGDPLGSRTRRRLRESVAALARSLDSDSLLSLFRLGRILREEQALSRKMAAPES